MTLTPEQAKLVQVQGSVMERDVLDVVRKIQEYDSNLKVQYLESTSLKSTAVSEAPYRIVEVCKDGVERLVFSVWKLDDTVLQRLFAADTQKWDIQGQLDRTNEKARASQKRRYKEEVLAPAREITSTVLKSPKSTYTVPKNVVDPDSDSRELVKFRDTPI